MTTVLLVQISRPTRPQRAHYTNHNMISRLTLRYCPTSHHEHRYAMGWITWRAPVHYAADDLARPARNTSGATSGRVSTPPPAAALCAGLNLLGRDMTSSIAAHDAASSLAISPNARVGQITRSSRQE